MIASWVSPRRFFIAAKVNGKFFRLRIQVANDYATAIQFDAGSARLVGYGTDGAYPRPAGEELHRRPRRRRNFQLSGGQFRAHLLHVERRAYADSLHLFQNAAADHEVPARGRVARDGARLDKRV